MLISRTLLQSLLDAPLPDDAALAHAITAIGFEVEGVQALGEGTRDVLVGAVVDKRPHPQAERLTLVDVDTGAGVVPVVCGAPNVPPPGGRIAFAPVGSTLPGGFRIEARAIRGADSHGMICSEQELDIGSDADGILVLPSDWLAGQHLADAIPSVADTIFELSITPNRPDALGHVGIARDLAVKLQCRLVLPAAPLPEAPPLPSLVTLDAPDRCGRYFGYAFEDATVGPSPPWMRVLLHRLGLRAISNVVDITNFILMKWGQPLHAFDRAKLSEGRVVVRRAREREPMRTLDDRRLELVSDDLVIADASVPQALAGVMGGEHSGVDTDTRTLLLEAAWFHPGGVRRTSRRHQISTDSSQRFERGVDHGLGLQHAVARAAVLLQQLCGARLVGGHEVVGQRPAVPVIPLRPARTARVLGMPIANDEARRILDGLEIAVDAGDAERWQCRAPTHRPDLQREEDLIEELMRQHGLDELPATPAMPTAATAIAPTGIYEPAGALSREHVDRLVDAFAAGGLHETVSIAFADPDRTAAVFGARASEAAVALKNPMRGQAAQLRVHLLPGLLDAAALNTSRHGRGAALFEVGRVYAWDDPGFGDFPGAPRGQGPTAAIDHTLPRERVMAAVLLVDSVDRKFEPTWIGSVMLDALARFGTPAHVRAADPGETVGHLHPGAQAVVVIDDRRVGIIGRLHPRVHAAWDLPAASAVWAGELLVDRLPVPRPAGYASIPRFPSTSRDLSLDVDARISAATIIAALRRAEARLASADDGDPPRLAAGDRGAGGDVEIIEDYRGAGVADGRRALLFRLHYRAADRSVTDDEVQARHSAVLAGALDELSRVDPAVKPR